jgi:uncharacterized SAM-binding protein YcdF (DUF218 family)
LALALNGAVTTNYFIWLFVKPSQWILLGALLALVFWRRPVGRRIGLVTLGLVVVFGLVPTGAWLMRPLETRFAVPNLSGDVTGVVVLSGSERVRLSALYLQPQLSAAGDRLTTFLLLAARYPQARLVYTGSAPEARIARSLLLGAGIEAGRIRFDERPRNTCDSARTAHALVEPRDGEQWLLVTSAFHMPRSIACFRAVGWDVIPYPADFRRGPSPWHVEMVDNLGDLDLAAHEWLGLVYYRLRGYTDELFPAPAPL